MGQTVYIPDDTWEPYSVAVGGRQEEAKELVLDTLEEHKPEVDSVR